MKQVVLKHALEAQPTAADFAVIDAPAPDGEVVARVVYLSLDPYVGSRLRGRHMGEAPPRPGVDAIHGHAVVRIEKSASPALKAGDYAHVTEGAWAEVVAGPAAHFRKLDPSRAPLAANLSSLGMPGLTAWAGITQLAKAQAGDMLLVDAAAGTVGGAAGQIAMLRGARAIGIAGGPEKCRIVRETYGFEACVDYKGPNWEAALDAALPAPPTIVFENVSVAMLVTALQRSAPYVRAVLCGLVDQYHAAAPPPQIPAGLLIGKRAQVLGLVVYDFYPRWDAFLAEAAPWVRDGKLKIVEDRAEGLENAPSLFEKLMRGENQGKCIVAVGSE
jgi:hypothetical protein